MVAVVGLLSHYMMPPPPASIGPFINGAFEEGVSDSTTSWQLVDPFPGVDIPSPVRIIDFPGNKSLVLSKIGYVYLLDKDEPSVKVVLDFHDKTFFYSDAGALGIALHPQFGNPDFPDKNLLFVYYRTSSNPAEFSELGYNVLSKFTWDSENAVFLPESEEILIQQFDRMPWHDGGSMFFGEDGLLYFAVGDEGKPEFQVASTQRIDGGFFSGVFRIDVDKDSTRSHPIRRQPQPLVTPPAAYSETFSQGYYIPNDNPWMDEAGGVLEEYIALGVRSPYTMHYDHVTKSMWVADVGSDLREEINNFVIGDNMQWPYMEGTVDRPEHSRPDSLIGNERSIVYEYDRTVGNAIIGAGVYYHNLYPDLYGKYIFGDYARNKFFVLEKDNQGTAYAKSLLTGIDHIALGLSEPVNVSGIFIQEDGRIFITVLNLQNEDHGKILELKSGQSSLSVPEKLSNVGAFEDLSSLNPIDGIIPYDVASALWSDRADKLRWVAIPHEGTFDLPEEKIDFDALDNYNFPTGTVFIKHFTLPTDLTDKTKQVPLETRFYIIGKTGSYGVTYAWNESGTEAYYKPEGGSRFIDIYDGDELAFTQQWDYPSWSQCLDCHTQAANDILGFRTHHLNRDLYYPTEGATMNQLDYFGKYSIFNTRINAPGTYPRAHPLDDETVPLEIRIRSYLDANCSSCHRSGHLQESDLDLRFSETYNLKDVLSVPIQSHASTINGQVVVPGHPELSELWIRDNSVGSNKMPPVGRNLVDQMYIDSLTKWIGGLEDNIISEDKNLLYPNPAYDWLRLQINPSWTLPVDMAIYDLQGRIITTEEIRDGSTRIAIEAYQPGIYLVQLIDAIGNKEIIKVAKR